jgi:hypothetical protein
MWKKRMVSGHHFQHSSAQTVERSRQSDNVEKMEKTRGFSASLQHSFAQTVERSHQSDIMLRR